MAQLSCIGLYKPCINLPFGDCAMYFDHSVSWIITFFACEHFSPSVCLSHPLSVLCVEATAVKRHFLGSHVLQPHEGRLTAKAVAPAISGRWFFNMFAVAKTTRTKSSKKPPTLVLEASGEASNTSVGSDWFCPQRTGKDLRGIGNRLAQHSRHHSHHDSHHDSQHDGRFHGLGQWHCGCLLGNGPRVLNAAGACLLIVLASSHTIGTEGPISFFPLFQQEVNLWYMYIYIYIYKIQIYFSIFVLRKLCRTFRTHKKNRISSTSVYLSILTNDSFPEILSHHLVTVTPKKVNMDSKRIIVWTWFLL